MLTFAVGYLIGWGADTLLQKMRPGPLRVLAYLATWFLLYMTLFLVMGVALELNGMSSNGPAAGSMAAGMTVALIALSISNRRDRKNQTNGKEEPNPIVLTGLDKALSEDPEDEEWELLRRYDPQVREAVEIIKLHGEEAENDLRKAFRVTGDKFQLERIAKEIDAENFAQAKKDHKENLPEHLMEQYGITRDDAGYCCRGHRYDELEDAVAFAKKTSFF